MKRAFLPRPGGAGIFTLLAAVLALIAGQIRGELVLTLLGVVFLAMLIYSFLALCAIGMLHRKKASRMRIEVITKQLTAGGTGELRCSGNGRLFGFPGVMLRIEMKLTTRDGRTVEKVFAPGPAKNSVVSFPVPERGAYFGGQDTLLLMDAPGFFRLRLPLEQERGCRLLAAPKAAEEKIPLALRSGGMETRNKAHHLKTDMLTENRPYVPGDDPRRINWKLYGHGPQSQLYVREGENAPPPRSRLLILLDTGIDPVLYNIEESQREIDRLCENALRAAGDLENQGVEVHIGYTGGNILPGGPEALAWPAALPLLFQEALPSAPPDTGLLILAAPRLEAGGTALDRFILSYNSTVKTIGSLNPEPDLLFLYSGNGKRQKEREEAANKCVAFYRRKQLRVRGMEISS